MNDDVDRPPRQDDRLFGHSDAREEHDQPLEALGAEPVGDHATVDHALVVHLDVIVEHHHVRNPPGVPRRRSGVEVGRRVWRRRARSAAAGRHAGVKAAAPQAGA
eukprot:scaffold1737_cov86-Isochrysis_galbana.AAC.2